MLTRQPINFRHFIGLHWPTEGGFFEQINQPKSISNKVDICPKLSKLRCKCSFSKCWSKSTLEANTESLTQFRYYKKALNEYYLFHCKIIEFNSIFMPNSLKNSSLANKQFQREKFHLEGKRITKRLKSHLSLRNLFMFIKLHFFLPNETLSFTKKPKFLFS